MFTPYCQVNYSEQLASIKKKGGVVRERERKKRKEREGKEEGRKRKVRQVVNNITSEELDKLTNVLINSTCYPKLSIFLLETFL